MMTKQRADALSFAQTVVRAYERGQWDVPKTYDLARELLAAEVELTVARSWPQDAEHENGNYECRCLKCESPFIGHKRRVFCRQCANSTPHKIVGYWRDDGFFGEFTIPTSGAIPEHGWMPAVVLEQPKPAVPTLTEALNLSRHDCDISRLVDGASEGGA